MITSILTSIGIFLYIFGSFIAVISWIRSDRKRFKTETRRWKEEVNKEMRDFHERIFPLNPAYCFCNRLREEGEENDR